MNDYFKSFSLHHPTNDDLQAVFDLVVACDIAELGEPDTDLEDIQGGWEDIDLSQDAWLVSDAAGTLIGYAAVFSRFDRFTFDTYAHPDHATVELHRGLFDLCEQRARQRLQTENLDKGQVTLYTSHTNHDLNQIVEAAGFYLKKYHYQLEIELDAPPSAPTWPEGSELRNFIPGQDERATFDFIQTAFDRPGRTPPSYEDWHSFMVGHPLFNPDLWFLLYAGESIIGAALCFDYAQSGWVRQLGVLPTHQRQGIGAALLQHVFGVFFQRGKPRIGLAVESENPNAIAFYERVGMKPLHQYNEYQKELLS
ncbi:MAG: GNAT family N-acetyltransferase [Anaerolineales bacterium]|nr:GNAT family N-acetyltransferase [Anaerolineales bacterium]